MLIVDAFRAAMESDKTDVILEVAELLERRGAAHEAQLLRQHAGLVSADGVYEGEFEEMKDGKLVVTKPETKSPGAMFLGGVLVGAALMDIFSGDDDE